MKKRLVKTGFKIAVRAGFEHGLVKHCNNYNVCDAFKVSFGYLSY
jgi:hypothetical protein